MSLRLAALALGVLTLAAFWQVRGFEFITYDDQGYVYENDHVKRGLSVENVRWAFTTDAMANWQPVTWLSHMLDVELFGLDAGWHHFTNVLLHVANTFLLFAVLSTMTGKPWRSLLVAALFALHPLHVESVAWVSERKDVLSTAFALLAIGAYVAWTRRPSRGRYWLTFLALALGLMAKPMLVTVPCLLLLLDVWPLRRREADGVAGWWSLVREKLPLFGLAAAMGVVTIVAQHHSGAVQSAAQFPLGARIANAIVAYTWYLRKALWPTDLATFYPLVVPVPPAAVIASAISLLLLTAAALLIGRRRRYVLVGWLWFLGMLVPVTGILQAGFQARADRFTYLPLVGIFIVAVWGAAELSAPWRARRPLRAALAGVVLAACFVATRTQVAYWRDSTTLFTHARAVTRDNYIAEANLGFAAAAAGRHAEAVEHYRTALRISPTFVEVHAVLGRELERVGTPESLADASRHFGEAVRLRPDDPEAYVNLGAVLRRLDRRAEARQRLDEALALAPNDARAHAALGLLLAEEGRSEEAIAQYETALRFAPAVPADATLAEVHYNLANALAAVGRAADAIAHFTESLRLDPAQPEAHNNLGVALADAGRDDEAAVHYRAAVALRPGYVDPHVNLAAVLRRAGRLDDAAAELDAALRLEPGHADAHYLLGNVLAQSGRLDAAAAHYVAALAARPRDPWAANNLGLVLAAQGRLDDAIGRYSEALLSHPDFAPAYYNRGVAYRNKGEVALADADLERARALDPRAAQ